MTFNRTIEQHGLRLPVSLDKLAEAMDLVMTTHRGVPMERIKVTVDGDALLWSVPVDWQAEDERRAL